MQTGTGDQAMEDPPQADLPSGGFPVRRAVALVLGLAALIIACDQVTKAAITARYQPCGNPIFYPILGPHAGFSYVCNTGTAFSRSGAGPT